MSKTQFTQHDSGAVTIAYDVAKNDGLRVSRTFFVRGAYVWEQHAGGDRQVCDCLYTRGSTLSGGQPLIDIIRREYRAMRRDEASEAARY